MESLQQQPGQEAVSPDQLVVMQLLEEIRRLILVPGGVNLPGVVNPRRLAAAKLYLDTRDAFEVVEKQVEEDMHDKPKLLRKLSKGSRGKSIASSATPTNSPRTSVSPRPLASGEDPLNDQVTDRIQDMFRDLGELLGAAILKELQQRKLTLQSILHYVRFLPAEYQWAAYRDARRDEVATAYRVPTSPRGGSAVANDVEAPAAAADNAIGISSSSIQALKRHSEFVKQQIRKDVDTVCLFAADGTLSTIFGDDVATVEENVADKFVTLLTDIYSQYLLPPLEAQVENLIQYSDQWSREVTEASATSVLEPLQPLATYYARPRRFRTKVNIFPDHLFGIDDRYTSLLLPPVPPGQHVKLLVADTSRVGVWWQKSVFSNTDRAVSTLHNDEIRKISSQVESLDGQIYSSLFGNTDLSSQMESSRRFGKSGWMAKWVGQRVLVNNGRDSLWVEVTITDFDDRKCKLKLKKSLEHYPLIETWTHFLMLNDWVNVRDLKFIGVPVCPDFRTFMGLRFRETLEVMHEVAVEISSIFPNDELAQKIGNSLWGLVERSIGKGEHIFSRYFRSMLQHDDLYSERRTLGVSLMPRRSSFGRSSGMKSMLDTSQASNGTGPSSAHLPVPAPGSPSRDEARKKGPTVGVFNANGRYVLQPLESLLSGSFSISSSQRYAVEPRISPFEKLSHHLLEETEVIGSCMQAHSVAISRAFVQVLVEKVSKIRRSSNERLHGGALLSVERVLAEYANAYRLLHVWRICRYELDTIPRQRRLRVVDTNAIHYKWVDRTFERMETEILETIEALSHYIHRTFFHECISQVLPGVFEQMWTASRPWFGNSRCTYAIQGFIFRFQVLLEHVDNPILSRHERNLGIHEKLHKILATMLLDVFASVAEAYMVMDVSRARGVQWKMDVLYLVCGVHKLVRLLDRMVSSRTPELKKSTSGKMSFACSLTVGWANDCRADFLVCILWVSHQPNSAAIPPNAGASSCSFWTRRYDFGFSEEETGVCSRR